ncbi:MAG TPA: hypothetical protein DEQ09_02420 [Bacteroidales bacterium]|nr:hypothetical protein [Bacteroidales bacterium]
MYSSMRDNDEYLYRFRAYELEISPEEIIEFIDKNHRGAGKEYKSLTRDLLAYIPDDHEYKGELKVFYKLCFEDSTSSLRINNIDFKLAEILYNEMRKSEMTAFFVCTAGNIFSDLSKRFTAEGDYLKAYIIDIAGNIAVTATATMIHRKITEEAGRIGMRTTNYYCPGNCGWNINEQQKVFEMLSGHYSGVMLSEVNLMYPVKSISAIVGIGKHVSFRENTCELCHNIKCPYRNKSHQEGK